VAFELTLVTCEVVKGQRVDSILMVVRFELLNFSGLCGGSAIVRSGLKPEM
jgi:hypothetical protein